MIRRKVGATIKKLPPAAPQAAHSVPPQDGENKNKPYENPISSKLPRTSFPRIPIPTLVTT